MSLPINISTSGLAARSDPYNFLVNVILEVPNASDPQMVVKNSFSFFIQAVIHAAPVAQHASIVQCRGSEQMPWRDGYATCTNTTAQLFPVAGECCTGMFFLLRDVEELPIYTNLFWDSTLQTEVSRCEDGPACAKQTVVADRVGLDSVGDGVYRVRIEANTIHDYVVHATLAQARLPFNISLQGQCTEGHYADRRLSHGLACRECPVGVACVGNDSTPLLPSLSLETLNLEPNFWRASSLTVDVRPCAGPGWQPSHPTPCKGGSDASNYCHDGRACHPIESSLPCEF